MFFLIGEASKRVKAAHKKRMEEIKQAAKAKKAPVIPEPHPSRKVEYWKDK